MTPYLIYIVIHLLLLLASINMNAISVAFPDITAAFQTSLVLAGWVISIYLLIGTAAAVLTGKVAEVLGKKKTFLICSALFIVGSLFAALAPNIYLLILARFIQSIGGGGLIPVVVAIIAELFPKSRQKAIGLSISIFNIGGIIGPIIGAWLVSEWGWRSIFWINIPVGIIVVIPVILILKADTGRKNRIDYLGAGLMTATLLLIMFAISQISSSNSLINWFLVGLSFLVGIILLVLFIQHEIKARDPIIELVLLRLKPFAASNIYSGLFGFGALSLSALLPLYTVSVYQLTTLQSGLVLSVYSISMIGVTAFSSFLINRTGYRHPMIIGTSLIALAIIVMAFQPPEFSLGGWHLNSIVILAILSIAAGTGIGMVNPAASNACVDLIPEKTATISGLKTMFIRCGGSVGIAITTIIIQSMSILNLGFKTAFIVMGALVAVAVPFIMAMPARPGAAPIAVDTEKMVNSAR